MKVLRITVMLEYVPFWESLQRLTLLSLFRYLLFGSVPVFKRNRESIQPYFTYIHARQTFLCMVKHYRLLLFFCLISACVSLLYHRMFQIPVDFMAGLVSSFFFSFFSFMLCRFFKLPCYLIFSALKAKGEGCSPIPSDSPIWLCEAKLLRWAHEPQSWQKLGLVIEWTNNVAL